MIDAFIDALETFPRGLVFVGLGLIILVIAKLARDVITPYRIDDEVTKKKNLAVAVRLSGYFLGVILVFLGALYRPFTLIAVDGLGFDREYADDVLRVFLYSLVGIGALNLVRILRRWAATACRLTIASRRAARNRLSQKQEKMLYPSSNR